jgi:hypothetical protein
VGSPDDAIGTGEVPGGGSLLAAGGNVAISVAAAKHASQPRAMNSSRGR